LKNGVLLLYDVTSTYLEGRCCELAKHGYSRDGRPDRPQLVIGLLCAPTAVRSRSKSSARDGVHAHDGNAADPATVTAQVRKLKDRFRLRHVALVGDRGMITSACIPQSLKPAGLDWITALRAPAIRRLATHDGPLQLSLFDDRDMLVFRSRLLAKARNADMAEISSPDYPGERLVVCKNPLLAEERRQHRENLLTATEQDLTRIKQRVERAKNPLRGAAAVGQAVGAVQDRHKVAKHFDLMIGEASFSFTRKTGAIAEEARLDGLYVLRTSLPETELDAAATVRAYKSLAQVERAFRSLKTVDQALRPVFHWSAERVRAHVLLCMLACYLEWHMRRQLAPMLFDDHDKPAARHRRSASRTRQASVSR
jgi:transposase